MHSIMSGNRVERSDSMVDVEQRRKVILARRVLTQEATRPVPWTGSRPA